MLRKRNSRSGYAARRMLNDARARRLRYTKKHAIAISRGPQCTAASDEKNLSIASKNALNESPTASGWYTPLRLGGGRSGDESCHPQQHDERGPRPRPVRLHE